jgi:hypothetical protein
MISPFYFKILYRNSLSIKLRIIDNKMPLWIKAIESFALSNEESGTAKASEFVKTWR